MSDEDVEDLFADEKDASEPVRLTKLPHVKRVKAAAAVSSAAAPDVPAPSTVRETSAAPALNARYCLQRPY